MKKIVFILFLFPLTQWAFSQNIENIDYAKAEGINKNAKITTDFSLYERQIYKKSEKDSLPYRILYPLGFNKKMKYPLFIMIHGMGLRGTDNERQLIRGGSLFIDPKNREKYKAIVIYPQCPATTAFAIMPHLRDKKLTETISGTPQKIGTIYFDMLHELILKIIASGNVDTNRIYIGGTSMGAITTYEMITEYPDLFAAATPIAGATYLQNLDKWKDKVAVWIFHGEEDTTVPFEASKKLVDRYKKSGVKNYRFTVFPGMHHDIWDKAFSQPDYLEWIFSQSKIKK